MLNFFSTKPKEPTKFDLYRGQYVSREQMMSFFPNQYVLIESPTEIQNKTVGGVLLFVHPKKAKVTKYASELPKPWANMLSIIDTNIYDHKNDDFAFICL